MSITYDVYVLETEERYNSFYNFWSLKMISPSNWYFTKAIKPS